MQTANILVSVAAAKIGYCLPLEQPALVRWESSDGFAYLEASGNGKGELTITLGHAANEEKNGLLAALTFPVDGPVIGAMRGEPTMEPDAIFAEMVRAQATMGPPSVIDSM